MNTPENIFKRSHLPSHLLRYVIRRGNLPCNPDDFDRQSAQRHTSFGSRFSGCRRFRRFHEYRRERESEIAACSHAHYGHRI
jgi:hypothetical protein